MTDGKLILAPMQGLTEVMFRKCYETYFPGALDYAISPFLSLTHGNLADAWEKIDDVWPERNKESIPVIPQILGKECEEFVALANRLYEVGYSEVNWNIGCPVRRVAHKHRGSGILPYPEEIQQILDYVVPRIQPRLSIKMRLGYYAPEEIFNIIPILNSYPLSCVTIHPRIGKQQYGGQVDLDTLDQVLPLLHHNTIYNGDIFTAERYRYIRERYPNIKDVMLGRGVLYNPLLPLEIKGITTHQEFVSTFISALISDIETTYPSEQARTRKTKEYWVLLRKSLPVTEQESLPVLHQTNFNDTKKTIYQLLTKSQEIHNSK